MKKELKFPEGFLWGSSVSSYQVEGGIENCNWSEDFPAGKACDYWNRFEEYFDEAVQLEQNVHRLSLEWSRIEPEEGKFDREALEHYKTMLKGLKKRDVKTMATLWHATIPVWLMKKGGWASLEAPAYFQNFVSFVVRELDGYVDFWLTINEPTILVSHSYLIGKFPPKEKGNLLGCGKAFFNLISAHKKAYRIIKDINPDTQVGMAENYSFVEPYSQSLPNIIAVRVWDFIRNQLFLNLTKKEQDFIGVNFYFHEKIKITKNFPFIENGNSNQVVSDLGWDIYPQGIYEVLKKLKKYKLPIYITENGIADAKDEKREKYICDHLKWVHQAISEGADVRGYLYWALLDNFEWADGFAPRFGLLEMNYDNMTYKVRPSALAYAKICKDNKLIIED